MTVPVLILGATGGGAPAHLLTACQNPLYPVAPSPEKRADLGRKTGARFDACFLLGRDSGWITGQVIPVDGGRSCVRTK